MGEAVREAAVNQIFLQKGGFGGFILNPREGKVHGHFDTRSREISLITGALAHPSESTSDIAGLACSRKIADFWASLHSKDEGSA